MSVNVNLVNTGNVGVRWSGLFESGLQQKGFQNFQFLLMKTRYFSLFFFDFGYFFILVQRH